MLMGTGPSLSDAYVSSGDRGIIRETMKRVRLLLFALALAAAACSNNSNATTTTTEPTPTTTNEYTGTLTLNGAASFPFAVLASGRITATILSLSPDSTVLVGFGIGVWDGVACDASPGIWQDKATQGSSVIATVTASGSLCVRIYDSQGTVADPTDYDIQVSHP